MQGRCPNDTRKENKNKEKKQQNFLHKMNIALIGYGKIGHMIEQIARERGHNIVSIIDVDNQADFES